MSYFSKEFINWLDTNANIIDKNSGEIANQLLKKIANEGVFKIGVPQEFGGDGKNDKQEIINFLSELGSHSLTAAFISWGHRTFIENILVSENSYARENWLPDLISGNLSGGTGLSNAMKFLSNVEELNVLIKEENGKLYLNGRLPWVTNLRSDNFVAVFVAGFENNSKKPIVLTVPSTAKNLSRSDDLQFVSLQGSNTASVIFENVELDKNWILSDDAPKFLSEVRPSFLGFQFGLAFGLANRCLEEVEKTLNTNRSILKNEWEKQQNSLNNIKENLKNGLKNYNYFIKNPKELFQLRIDIIDIVAQCLLLELEASGGSGYFKNSKSSFMRRWNEGAFLPIITPSAVQLRIILENN